MVMPERLPAPLPSLPEVSASTASAVHAARQSGEVFSSLLKRIPKSVKRFLG